MDQVQPATSSPSDQPIESTSPPSSTAAPSQTERLASRYPNDPPKDAAAAESGRAKEPQSQAQQYSLTAPEGFEIDNVMMDAASPVFADMGLTNESAQKLMPLAMQFRDRLFQSQRDEFAGIKADWARQAEKDPEIGGSNWASTRRLAGAALEAAGVGPKHPFRELLNESGLGNHPEMLKVFARLGRKLAGSTSRPSSADVLRSRYPTE